MDSATEQAIREWVGVKHRLQELRALQEREAVLRGQILATVHDKKLEGTAIQLPSARLVFREAGSYEPLTQRFLKEALAAYSADRGQEIFRFVVGRRRVRKDWEIRLLSGQK